MIIYVNKLWDEGKTQLMAPGQTTETHSMPWMLTYYNNGFWFENHTIEDTVEGTLQQGWVYFPA